MVKRVITATAGIVVIGVVAAPAAEASTVTLPRLIVHAKAYTIRPQTRLPVGARLISAKVTVKRGSRVVARNVSRVTVARGSYVAVSAVAWRPRIYVSRTVSLISSKCRVASRVVTSDRTSITPGDPSFGIPDTQAGQVTVQYTGSCTGYDSNLVARAFTGTWIDDVYVYLSPPGDPLTESSVYKIGDVAYPIGMRTTIRVATYGAVRTQVTVRAIAIVR